MSFDEKSGAQVHRVILEDRSRLTVSGVDGVESFDESSILMTTAQGMLIIRGSGLHIEKLSLDGGDLLVEGTVDALTYEEEDSRQGSFLGRLFRGCASPPRPRPWSFWSAWGWGPPWGCSTTCCACSPWPFPGGGSGRPLT